MAYPDLFEGMTAEQKVAQGQIRAYCRWHIAPAVAEVLTIDGPGTSFLGLPSALVTAISAVTEDGVALVVDDDFEWSAAGYVERNCWTRKLRGVTVSLTHGYAVCPDDIKNVVTHLAEVPTGLSSASIGSAQYSLSGRGVLDDESMLILDKYRILR